MTWLRRVLRAGTRRALGQWRRSIRLRVVGITVNKAKIPLARFAHAEEIAKAVIFLVADGDYITGEQININGGAFEA